MSTYDETAIGEMEENEYAIASLQLIADISKAGFLIFNYYPRLRKIPVRRLCNSAAVANHRLNSSAATRSHLLAGRRWRRNEDAEGADETQRHFARSVARHL